MKLYQQDIDYCKRSNQTPVTTMLRLEQQFGDLRESHRQSMHRLVLNGTPGQRERATRRRKNVLLERLADLDTARQHEEMHIHETVDVRGVRGALFDLGAKVGELRKTYIAQSHY